MIPSSEGAGCDIRFAPKLRSQTAHRSINNSRLRDAILWSTKSALMSRIKSVFCAVESCDSGLFSGLKNLINRVPVSRSSQYTEFFLDKLIWESAPAVLLAARHDERDAISHSKDVEIFGDGYQWQLRSTLRFL